jgi:hypothetical protein
VGTEHDDHYWDVVAQRQFLKVIGWLEDFITPEFRARVWQDGTKAWERFEESEAEFFSDFNIEGLIVDGLARLGIDADAVTCLAEFVTQFDAFSEAIPHPVNAKQLEARPAFHETVAEARKTLGVLAKAQKSMRVVVDDL